MDRARVFSIYSEVLDAPAGRRDALIRDRCEGDAALEAEVRSLLDAQAQGTLVMDGGVDELRHDYWRSLTGDDQHPEEDLSGGRFGAWELIERVGRGGLATVYRAERADGEFSQTSAFKVLRRGLDTEDVIARFRIEREILASLSHPGIASILDGGSLPDGRPYLVLEFVDGMDVVRYATSNRLSVAQRLSLIQQVADALNHAHQRLVVHRDIKPSNVMVTGAGTVRLLDFGIARILDPSAGPLAARLTRTGVHLLTPAYGSPEQTHGLPVTTASDVYQLGLLMSEVLTGVRPAAEPGQAPLPQLAELGDRDLRAIVDKATRAEPEQRYGSVRELAEDIERYRGNLPVRARSGSWRYRTGKFLKRRPLLAPGVAVVAIALAGYVLTITSYSRELERERTIAEKTREFMIRLFESPNPSAPIDPDRGRAITVVEALDIGRDRLLGELAEQPALDASLSAAISAVYAALDQYRPAIELRERALAIEADLYGTGSGRALASMRELARLHAVVGDDRAAAAWTDRQLAIARGLKDPGVERGLAEHAAAEQALRTGDTAQGETLLEGAIADLVSQDAVAERLDEQALLALLGSARTAEDPATQIYAMERIAIDTLGRETPDALIIQSRVASSLYDVGALAAAETRFLELIPRMERILGEDHPDTLATRNNLAILYSGTERYAEAEAVHADLLSRRLKVFGSDSRAVADSYQNLATVLSRQTRYAEAIELHRRAYQTYARILDEKHFATTLPLLSIAFAQLESGRAEAAEESARGALERAQQHRPDSPLVPLARCLIGTARIRLGDPGAQALIDAARAALIDARVPAPYATLCGVAA